MILIYVYSISVPIFSSIPILPKSILSILTGLWTGYLIEQPLFQETTKNSYSYTYTWSYRKCVQLSGVKCTNVNRYNIKKIDMRIIVEPPKRVRSWTGSLSVGYRKIIIKNDAKGVTLKWKNQHSSVNNIKEAARRWSSRQCLLGALSLSVRC